MRGNPIPTPPRRRNSRSIPAYAGEPRPAVDMPSRSKVYPRVCGGTAALRSAGDKVGGLSPRMRGNPNLACFRHIRRRSIPAYAGEPWPGRVITRPAQVYPRVCGGTGQRGRVRQSGGGLSPRMRGNRPLQRHDLPRPGSIPAYAGEPSSYQWMPPARMVYPRVCGGTGLDAYGFAHPGGLSPRMRGNRTRCLRLRASGRSIPAYAGEPTAGPIRRPSTRVYPRVCGGTSARPLAQSAI